jgi:uncharacterized protein (DUF1499 family)
MLLTPLILALSPPRPPTASTVGRTPQAMQTTRRAALAAVATAAAAAGPLGAHAATITGDASRRCQTLSNPATTIVTCQGFGLTADARLNGCSADEACVGTSAVRNPSKYAPPWSPPKVSPESTNAARAWRAVVGAVNEEESLTLVERDDERRYLRAVGTSAVPSDGQDDVEFVLRESPVNLLYRSATRQAVFVYPLQQPLANQKSHVERLASIRARLGWEEAGLPTDGAGLASEMMSAYKVPTAQRIFGIQLGGVKVNYGEDEDD